jgi:hypothetical protein
VQIDVKKLNGLSERAGRSSLKNQHKARKNPWGGVLTATANETIIQPIITEWLLGAVGQGKACLK